MGALYGTAVAHKSVIYISHHFDLYSYQIDEDEWKQLPSSEYQSFGLAVVDNQPTTVGGISRDKRRTKDLLALVSNRSGSKKWEESYPPMPTHRLYAATLTTPTHLVVAGGRDKSELQTVEVMSRENFQWSKAIDLPEPMGNLQMILSSGKIYVCTQQSSFYSYSLEKFIRSVHSLSDSNAASPVRNGWTKLSDMPSSSGHYLAVLGGQLVVVGGCDEEEREIATVSWYDCAAAEWRVVGEMPEARVDVLAVAMPAEAAEKEELVVVGGWSNSSAAGSGNATLIGKQQSNA